MTISNRPFLIRDRNGKFTVAFDAASSAEQTRSEDDRGRPAGREAGRVDVRPPSWRRAADPGHGATHCRVPEPGPRHV